MMHDGGYWRKSYGTSTAASDDTSSRLVYVTKPLPSAPDRSKYAKSEGTCFHEPHGNRRPDWWKPPQLRREKRPLAVRLWQSERRASKKTARTNERRERKSRA